MDPLSPITPSTPAVSPRRVPPVDRLRRISRDGDKPQGREDADRDQPRRKAPYPGSEGEDGHQGRIDVRV